MREWAVESAGAFSDRIVLHVAGDRSQPGPAQIRYHLSLLMQINLEEKVSHLKEHLQILENII